MIARRLPPPTPQTQRFRRWPAGAPPGIAIEPGLVGWYDASQETYGNNVPCPVWHDRSGLGHHLSQHGTSIPTFRTNQQNGLPMVSFDGIDDFLSTSYPAGWASATGATIISLHKIVTPGSYNVIFSARRNDLYNDFELRNNVTATGLMQIAGGGATPAYSLVPIDALCHAATGSYDTSDGVVTIYDAWTQEHQATETYQPGIGVEVMSVGGRGASLFFSGMIGELMVFARRLSYPEILDKIDSLNIKWSLV